MDSLYRNTAIFSVALLIFLFGLLYSLNSKDFPEITGMPMATLRIVSLTPRVCNFTVNEGWNLISIPCLEDNIPVSFALESVYTISTQTVNLTNTTTNTTYLTNITNTTTDFYSVHAFDSLDSLDPWKSYNPSLPGYVIQDLSYMIDKKGYFIRMKNDSMIYYAGEVSIPNYIDLYQGWNLVGYATNDTESNRSVSNSISTINDSYTTIYHYVSGSWLVYNETLQQFTTFMPFRGYWFIMSDNDTWVIDW